MSLGGIPKLKQGGSAKRGRTQGTKRSKGKRSKRAQGLGGLLSKMSAGIGNQG
jgi:hypothetical protein